MSSFSLSQPAVVVTPDGVRPATVADPQTGSVAVIQDRRPGAAPASRSHRCRRASSSCRSRRLARAHQRSRPHRVGRLRARDERGGCRRRHDARRHAAQQHSGDDDRAGLEAKRARRGGRCHVDVGFWGGVVPGNSARLEPLARAGVLGFKCFLCPSGVDEFAHVTEADLREGACRSWPGSACRCWCTPSCLSAAVADRPAACDPRRYATWLDSRPPASEQRRSSCSDALAASSARGFTSCTCRRPTALRRRCARRAGVPITVETCPHYLTFAAETSPTARPRSSARRRSARARIANGSGWRSGAATSISSPPITRRRRRR